MTTWIQRGKVFYAHSPIEFLTQQNAATPQRVSLAQWVPSGALSFRVRCALYRGVADQYGNTDVAGICRLPGWQGTAPNYTDAVDFDKFGQAALSGASPSVPAGTLVESLGSDVEIPNMTDAATHAVFYWLNRGNTINGAQITLQLLSYRMP